MIPAIVNYHPVPLSGPFDSIKKIDTIFAGQSITLHSNGNGNITWNSHSTLSCVQLCQSGRYTPDHHPLTAVAELPLGCRVTDEYTL